MLTCHGFYVGNNEGVLFSWCDNQQEEHIPENLNFM